MWSNRVALASRTSVKASARLCRKLQRCQTPRCFSLATKVMHIINPYTCNVPFCTRIYGLPVMTCRLHIDEASKNLHYYVSVLLVVASRDLAITLYTVQMLQQIVGTYSSVS